MSESQVDIEMPRYKCHKEVWALKISKVESHLIMGEGGPRYLLSFVDPGYASIEVDFKIVSRYMPKPGDYYVVYHDGYKSISPAKAFEEGYVKVSR